MSTAVRKTEGVYAQDPDGVERLVHEYIGETYSLADLPEFMGLGRVEDDGREIVLTLTRPELRDLKTGADARSFDFEDGFIQMCYDIHRFADGLTGDTARFVSES